jgi:hypothetical protein
MNAGSALLRALALMVLWDRIHVVQANDGNLPFKPIILAFHVLQP